MANNAKVWTLQAKRFETPDVLSEDLGRNMALGKKRWGIGIYHVCSKSSALSNISTMSQWELFGDCPTFIQTVVFHFSTSFCRWLCRNRNCGNCWNCTYWNFMDKELSPNQTHIVYQRVNVGNCWSIHGAFGLLFPAQFFGVTADFPFIHPMLGFPKSTPLSCNQARETSGTNQFHSFTSNMFICESWRSIKSNYKFGQPYIIFFSQRHFWILLPILVIFCLEYPCWPGNLAENFHPIKPKHLRPYLAGAHRIASSGYVHHPISMGISGS